MCTIFWILIVLGILYPGTESSIGSSSPFRGSQSFGLDATSTNESSGHFSSLIVNGDPAIDGQFPYQVVILELRGGRFVPVCGGSLIENEAAIITAAHCFYDNSQNLDANPDNYRVRAGSINVNHGVERTIQEIQVHSQYDAGRHDLGNDIAVLQLAQPFQRGPQIDSILLDRKRLFGENEICTISGFGSTAVRNAPMVNLRFAHIHLRKIDVCRQSFGNGLNGTIQVCAGGPPRWGNHCSGDSGGPLACTYRGKKYLHGVISFGPKNCLEQSPGVSTVVSSYVKWIDGVMRNFRPNNNAPIHSTQTNTNAGNNPGQKCTSTLPKLTVLPGMGWDNLRNMELRPIHEYSYDSCKTSPDGLHLIPDHIFVSPSHKSDVQLYSEIIESSKEYKSLTANSINAEIQGIIPNTDVTIGGSFSRDYVECKRKLYQSNLATVRSQVRYHLYTIGATLDSTHIVSPHLLAQFQKVIAAIKAGNVERTDYILELIVRNYGTHFLTHVETGGILYQEDYIQKSYLETEKNSSYAIKAAASAKFLEIFKFNLAYTRTANESLVKNYTRNVRSSRIQSYGGGLIKPGATEFDAWVESIPAKMVAIDRKGEPLHFMIVPNLFPHEDERTVHTLRKEMQEAVRRYYNHNKKVGCMDSRSKIFNYNANVDSKNCNESSHAFKFGGVFQTCTREGTGHNLCGGKEAKNMLTGTYTCPRGYKGVRLVEGWATVEYTCYVWLTCTARYKYEMFWCVDVTGEKQGTGNQGLLFGGVYTPKENNPVTHSTTCPPTFTPVKVLSDLFICVGNNYELGAEHAVSFGGFFSCQAGNPLHRGDLAVLTLAMLQRLNTTEEILGVVSHIRQACPAGFTQHTATIKDDCLINYCVQIGALLPVVDEPIVLPPFKVFVGRAKNSSEAMARINEENSSQAQGMRMAGAGVDNDADSGSMRRVRVIGETTGDELPRDDGPYIFPSFEGFSSGFFNTGSTSGVERLGGSFGGSFGRNINTHLPPAGLTSDEQMTTTGFSHSGILAIVFAGCGLLILIASILLFGCKVGRSGYEQGDKNTGKFEIELQPRRGTGCDVVED